MSTARIAQLGFADFETDGIVVRELPLEPAGDFFDGVIDDLRRHSFDAGYALALIEIRAKLALLAEEFVRLDPESRGALRETLYAFGSYVHRRLYDHSPDDAAFGDGLGI